LAKC
ncbi:hypothetical protein D049_3933B, partial [Vibrio parahaemolyticus VPTS-2010]